MLEKNRHLLDGTSSEILLLESAGKPSHPTISRRASFIWILTVFVQKYTMALKFDKILTNPENNIVLFHQKSN